MSRSPRGDDALLALALVTILIALWGGAVWVATEVLFPCGVTGQVSLVEGECY